MVNRKKSDVILKKWQFNAYFIKKGWKFQPFCSLLVALKLIEPQSALH